MLGRAVIGAVEYACRLLKERVDVTYVEGRGEVVGKKVLYLQSENEEEHHTGADGGDEGASPHLLCAVLECDH